MTDRAETCPPRDTSPIPADWPDVADNLPLLPLWPFLSPACKAEVKAALALLRQKAHPPAKRVTVHCPHCGSVAGEAVAAGVIRFGTWTVRFRRGRSAFLTCPCGHAFTWNSGRPAASPLDTAPGTHQDR